MVEEMKQWKKLFPNTAAFVVFSLYIILFVFQGVFITASKTDSGGYDYNTTLVVFTSEGLKLIASAILYTCRRGKRPNLLKAMLINYELLLLYFIPSLLYCFYNNLAFINLSHYDPTSYYVLLQFRVVLTALLFQCLFSKNLTSYQWVGLGVLTMGCIIKNFDAAAINYKQDSDLWSQVFNIYFLSINFQNFCSCLAGTYNEYLLKTKGSNVDIFLQNVYMYLDSVACNFAVLLYNEVEDMTVLIKDYENFDIYVILITINSAIVGIVTSFFLKNLNSILKTYASALELLITAVVCYILFRIPITWNTIVSIGLVSIAVAMYFKSPVNNTNFSSKSHVQKDKEPLLDNVVEEV